MNLQSDRTVIFNDWNVGFRKVEFTKMLQSQLSLGLSEAKKATDKILDRELVEFRVSSQTYSRVVELANQLGAVVLEKESEAACR